MRLDRRLSIHMKEYAGMLDIVRLMASISESQRHKLSYRHVASQIPFVLLADAKAAITLHLSTAWQFPVNKCNHLLQVGTMLFKVCMPVSIWWNGRSRMGGLGRKCDCQLLHGDSGQKKENNPVELK